MRIGSFERDPVTKQWSNPQGCENEKKLSFKAMLNCQTDIATIENFLADESEKISEFADKDLRFRLLELRLKGSETEKAAAVEANKELNEKVADLGADNKELKDQMKIKEENQQQTESEKAAAIEKNLELTEKIADLEVKDKAMETHLKLMAESQQKTEAEKRAEAAKNEDLNKKNAELESQIKSMTENQKRVMRLLQQQNGESVEEGPLSKKAKTDQ